MPIASRPENVHSTLNARLKKAFPFTDEDLEANRAREFSKAQRKRLIQDYQSDRLLGWGFILMCLFIGGSFTLISTVRAGDPGWNPGIRSECCGVLLAGIILAVVVRMWFKKTNLTYLLEMTLMSAQGPVRCEKMDDYGSKSHQRRYYYMISIGDRSFSVSESRYAAFVDGEEYVLYHTAYRIISAEHVAHDENDLPYSTESI